jgi:hypothetical protein
MEKENLKEKKYLRKPNLNFGQFILTSFFHFSRSSCRPIINFFGLFSPSFAFFHALLWNQQKLCYLVFLQNTFLVFLRNRIINIYFCPIHIHLHIFQYLNKMVSKCTFSLLNLEDKYLQKTFLSRQMAKLTQSTVLQRN